MCFSFFFFIYRKSVAVQSFAVLCRFWGNVWYSPVFLFLNTWLNRIANQSLGADDAPPPWCHDGHMVSQLWLEQVSAGVVRSAVLLARQPTSSAVTLTISGSVTCQILIIFALSSESIVRRIIHCLLSEPDAHEAWHQAEPWPAAQRQGQRTR